jgi:hypothetical protein
VQHVTLTCNIVDVHNDNLEQLVDMTPQHLVANSKPMDLP